MCVRCNQHGMPLHLPRGIALAVFFSVLTAPVLLAGPSSGQGHAASPPAHASHEPAAVPDHSVSGVVKLVDSARLVITRAGKTPVEMTFAVNASTLREGHIAVGTKVQVRFRGDGHPAVATAILATQQVNYRSTRSTSPR
jgi:hypothetical protein